MPRSPKILLTTGLTVVALLSLAAPVNAARVEQSQELEQKTTVTVSGNSHSESKAEVRQWAKQSQSVELPAHRWGWVEVSAETADRPQDAMVTLRWPQRGGTCHIRYTEAGQRHYKYTTAASCDQGELTIGGLTAGQRYRFQVRQDNHSWSRPVTVRAW